jgi:hypothetical protein
MYCEVEVEVGEKRRSNQSFGQVLFVQGYCSQGECEEVATSSLFALASRKAPHSSPLPSHPYLHLTFLSLGLDEADGGILWHASTIYIILKGALVTLRWPSGGHCRGGGPCWCGGAEK